MKKKIFRYLYLILKKDIVKKLYGKGFGEQFIDNVMEALEMPTNFMRLHEVRLLQERKEEIKENLKSETGGTDYFLSFGDIRELESIERRLKELIPPTLSE